MTSDVEWSEYDWGHAGKIGYLNKGEAEHEAAYLESNHGEAMHVYRCGVCDLWHVGHPLAPDALTRRAARRAGPFEIFVYETPEEPPPPDPRLDLLALTLLGPEFPADLDESEHDR